MAVSEESTDQRNLGGTVQYGDNLSSWPTKMDSAGRIMIPAEARNARHWAPGTELVLEELPDGTVRVTTLAKFIEGIQDYFSTKIGGRVLSKELIQERRQEAEHEESRH